MEDSQKAKKPWYKRWWAILFFILIGMGILGNVTDPPTSEKNVDNSVMVSPAQQTLFVGDPLILLPTREELPTEFRTESLTNKSDSVSLSDRTIKFSSKSQSFSKSEGSVGSMIFDFSALKFDSMDDARLYFAKSVSSTKEKGGYTEIESKIGSNCFAFKVDLGFQLREGEHICIRNNIVFSTHITAVTTIMPIDRYVNDLQKIFNERIKTANP